MKNLLPFKLEQHISKRKAVKIITGLNNFSTHSILKIVKAAELGQASYVDVAANPELVAKVKSITTFPLCVSSIDPLELQDCVMKGADIIEIGNFDIFYNRKIFFSFEQILNLTKETKDLIPDIPICVTIPHTLLLADQIRLAILLEQMGVSVIQTEGYLTKDTINLKNFSLMKSIINASSAISSTYAISRFVNIPIIASSGINSLSASAAFSYGASIVGIGSAVSNYNTITDMAIYIHEVVSSITSPYNKSIIVPQLCNIDPTYHVTF
uniref:Uncharacterized protein ycf23 n=1 Tax=Gracilaria firma TaxID=2510791 RepID=A0A1P8D6M1_9FLOR|nr:hypothetical protein [Gracilaria firma]APR74450.1 hypothetical protein [Gracilaria firma]